jgi:hypothetical protein
MSPQSGTDRMEMPTCSVQIKNYRHRDHPKVGKGHSVRFNHILYQKGKIPRHHQSYKPALSKKTNTPTNKPHCKQNPGPQININTQACWNPIISPLGTMEKMTTPVEDLLENVGTTQSKTRIKIEN